MTSLLLSSQRTMLRSGRPSLRAPGNPSCAITDRAHSVRDENTLSTVIP